MLLVLLLAAALWGLGMVLKTPTSARWLTIGLLFVAVLMLQIALPAGHPLREATGGEAAPWLLLAGLAALIWAYSRWLKGVKARVAPEAASPGKPFRDVELERYARHIVLREIGGPGQKKLKDAKVLVVGAGGLGSPALLYLAAAGVGEIGVIDDDTVDHTNLQRQIIFRDDATGYGKAGQARKAMLELNPFVTVKSYSKRLTDDIAADLIAAYDLVLDGTDDFDTRYLVNRTCVALGKPLIGAALTQWEGQISLYDPARDVPCYACVFPQAPDPSLAPSCAEAGVLGPLPGVIGSMMAVEAVKEIAGAGAGLRGRMLIYDALYAETRIINLKRNPDCAVCGTGSGAA